MNFDDIRVSSPSTDGSVMRSEKSRFTLTAQHITLLRAAYVNWQNCETGAPEIDPKRPYGNSCVLDDVAEALGIPIEYDPATIVHYDSGSFDGEMSEEQSTRLMALHRETATALQIVLATGAFTPGVYEVEPYSRKWTLVTP